MRANRLQVPLLASLIACTLAAGCGGSGGGEGIPADDAEMLLQTVQQIDTAQASEDCEGAKSATTALRQEVEALAGEIDAEIEDGLNQMITRVDEQLDDECVRIGTSEPEEDEETSTDTAEEPVEPAPAPVEEEPVPEEEPPPPEEDEEEPAPAPEEDEEEPAPPSDGGDAGTGAIGAEDD